MSETTTTTRNRAVTYVCNRKGCGKARQIIYSVRTTRTTVWGLTGMRTSRHETWSREGAVDDAYPHSLTCDCGAHMEARPVSGRYSENHKCGARCRNAKSGDCECQCGGANHGSAHRG